MKKRILGGVLLLCLLLSLLPTAALGAGGAEGPEARYQEAEGGDWVTGTLAEACAGVYSGGIVEVLRDIELESGVTVTKPMTIRSEDKEHPCKITYNPKNHGDFLLKITVSGQVSLTDVILDGGREAGRTSQSELVWAAKGTLALCDGAIIQNNSNVSGTRPSAGGIHITHEAQVQLRSGSYVKNCRGGAGGGVSVVGSNGRPPSSPTDYHLLMVGGVIENCEAFRGGGVYIEQQGTMAFLPGDFCSYIRGNRAVKNPDNPENHVDGSGGGVFIELVGYIQMYTGAIEGNSAEYGGGIYLTAGNVILRGGKVSNNRAKESGGGIYVTPLVSGTTVTLGDSPNVTGNSSGNGYFDNVFLVSTQGASKDDTRPITIAKRLEPTSSIGVSRWLRPDKENPYRIVAIPKAGVTISEDDLKKFYSDDPSYIVLLREGNIVLTTADVRFDNMGHGERPPSQLVDADHKVDEPAPLEERGYHFVAWYREPEYINKWDFGTDEILDDDEKTRTLYARWELNHYQIEYVLGEGGENGENPDEYTIEDVKDAGITLKDPSREGYRFLGWKLEEVDEERVLRQTPVPTSSTLSARSLPSAPRSADSPDAGEPETPVAPDLSELPYTEGIGVGSIGYRRFVAIWEKLCTVTYTDGVGGSVFADDVHEDVRSGADTPAFRGETPTREGYIFKGWAPEVTEKVTDSVTYVAQWEPKGNSGFPNPPAPPTGGDGEPPATLTPGPEASAPPAPDPTAPPEPDATPKPTPDPVPQTGDPTHTALWAGCALASLAGIALLLRPRRRRR